VVVIVVGLSYNMTIYRTAENGKSQYKSVITVSLSSANVCVLHCSLAYFCCCTVNLCTRSIVSFVMRLIHDLLAFTVFLLTASLNFTQFLLYT